jgi:competence protein ComEC
MRMLILFFAIGTGLCQLQAMLLPWRWAMLGALTLGIIAWGLRLRCKRVFLCVNLGAALITGLSFAAWRAELRLAERLPTALERQDLLIEGRVIDLPQRTERGIRFLLEPDPLRVLPGVAGRLSLTWYSGAGAAPPMIRSGERWRLLVRLRQPHASFNPPGFDHEAWLFERGISAQGYVRNSASNARVKDFDATPMAWVDHWREAIRQRFETALPESAWRGVLVALVVGDQAAIPEAQWALFRATGTTHLMSISGLHVTLIAILMAGLTGWLWRRFPALMLQLPAQKAALPVGVLAAGFYVLIAGAGVPALRTFCMLFVAAIALFSGRAAGASRIMAAALLCVLLLDPWALLSAGFWLSFGAVGALLLIGGGARRASGPGSVRRWAVDWLRAQWAVTLLALPILLGLFQQFSLVSPLANLLAIPVISMLVTPLAMLFAILPLPSLALLLAWLTGLLMRFLTVLADFPLAMWQQAAPPSWLVAACVLAALWALLPRGVPARWTGLLVFLPLLGYMPERPAAGEMRVNVLDVGQGLAVHVQTASRDLLFDTGPQYSPEADAGQRILLPWLRAQGVNQLNELVLSHADKDHAGGAASLLASLPVRGWASSLPESDPLRRTVIPHRSCVAGESWQADGVRFAFLHPVADWNASENDRSCVLKVSSPYGSVLLTGDISLRSEAILLESRDTELSADVLLAPHHGSRTSSGAAFIAAVGARHVVFTAGYLNRFHHPAPDVVARYEAPNVSLYRSDRDGLVSFRFGATGIQAERMRASHRRYWHDPD